MHTNLDDPNRCHGVRGGDVCMNKAVNGSEYCEYHGDNKKSNISQYRLSKFQARLEEKAGQSNIKSLRDEIAILRITLEERLNSMQSPLEILTHTHTIGDMCLKIEKLVTSCHKLEKSMNNFMDETQATQFGLELVQIITRHVDDTKAIENIVNELSELIKNLYN